jgi:RHS repeat-associated protein
LGDGPERQRIRQDKHDGATVNYAGAQEVEVSNTGAVTLKTYLPQGIGVEIDRATGNTVSTEVNYVHHDRLGSPVAITDAVGNVKERMAYDAWGKRRTIDGAATPNNLDGIVDNRGFTNHEMLDHLDLVHMNGRVYEPLLGRFLSADPILQDPMNGQSYNRYAYVFNNPTNLTDPTGFMGLEGLEGCSVNNGGCFSQAIAQSRQQQQQLMTTPGQPKKSDKPDKSEKSDGLGNAKQDAKKPESSAPRVLTTGDVYQSLAAGVGNAIANMAVGFANVMIATGDPHGNANLIEPVKPFTPVSNYFGNQGSEIAGGLAAVSGARAFGASVASKVEGASAAAATNLSKGAGVSVVDPLAAANKPFNESGISQAARAWDKHSMRPGGTFEPLSGTTSDKNAAAAAWVRSTIENTSTTKTVLPRGGIEYRLPNGRGFVVEPNGNFNLLDPRRNQK